MATIDFPLSPNVGDIYSANTKSWQFKGYGWKAVSSAGAINTAQRQTYTASAGQTSFTTPSAYVQGANQVSLFINGVRQYSSDYTETTNNSITLSTGATLNDSVLIEINSYTGNPLVINTPTIINQGGSNTTGYISFATANSGSLTTISTDSANLTYNVVTGYVGTKGIKFGDGTIQITAGGAPNTIYNGTSNVGFTGVNGNSYIYVNGSLSTTFAPTGVTVNNGLYSVGTFGATYTDGIVVDYTTGTGRISVGTADGITFYNGGPAGNALMSISATGVTTIPTSTPSTSSSTGGLVVGGGLGVAGAIYSGGLVSAGSAGFQTTTYSNNVRNRIWSFGNADGFGLSYFQGTSGFGGTDSIGLHFGTATAASSQFSFAAGGNFYATGSGTFFYSDKRLKTEVGKIENALDKIDQLTGVLYTQNKLAEQYGYNNYEEQVGLYAQDVQQVQPQAVKPAPFDIKEDGTSKSGENYMTVQYERLIPLLVEGIKELRVEIKKLKGE